ncbi:MAG: class I SAM-dependent methyltransferase [Patescibacteria group bacterium]|nr:class I SAM-dependent methyltransferase [Patescibacteria group bacterium]
MIDETIPGPSEIAELRYLEKLVTEIPASSEIVEVGTFLGRAAYVLAATRPDCNLTVIDPFDCNVGEWLRGPTIRGEVSRYSGQSQFDTFKQFMNGHENVRVCVGKSPLPRWMLSSPNLVFIDAAHNYDAIAADIAYWSTIATSPTALCGHDYCDEFSDVKQAVNEFANRNNLGVHVEPGTTIWKFFHAA